MTAMAKHHQKSVYSMILEAQKTGNASELADFVAAGGLIPSEPLAELLRHARILKKPGGQKGPRDLAKQCAAYIVWCCVDNYRAKSGTLPPRDGNKDVLKEMAEAAIQIVCDHFGLPKSYEPSEIIGHRTTKTPPYQRSVHDEACIAVHSEMQEQLLKLLDMQDADHFPALPRALTRGVVSG